MQILQIYKSTNIISPKKKIPKNVCTLNFVNKGIEDFNVSKIFQMKNVNDSLQLNLRDHENISVTTYKLTATIWNKICNYRQTVES